VIDGKYRVTDVLGLGRHGPVYTVEHVAGMLERPLALKLFEPGTGAHAALMASLKRARRLVNRYLVPVRDVGRLGRSRAYVLMDLAAGTSLAALLEERGRLEPAAVLGIARRAARVLAAAHTGGILHGGLSLRDILIEPGGRDGSVRVLGFGLLPLYAKSWTSADAHATGDVAPEVRRGEEFGPPADVYALAAILYRAVAGIAHTEGAVPVPLEAIDPALRRWPRLSHALEGGLDPDPGSRPSARAFLEALDAAAAGLFEAEQLEGTHAASVCRRPVSPAARRLAGPPVLPWVLLLSVALAPIAFRLTPALVPGGRGLPEGRGTGSHESAMTTTADVPAAPTAIVVEPGISPPSGPETAAAPSPPPPPSPSPGATLRGQGHRAFQGGNYPLARASLERAWELGERDPGLPFILGEAVYLSDPQGSWTLAIAWLRRSEELRARDIRQLIDLAAKARWDYVPRVLARICESRGMRSDPVVEAIRAQLERETAAPLDRRQKPSARRGMAEPPPEGKAPAGVPIASQ
jgi:serine/threonine protein kinase